MTYFATFILYPILLGAFGFSASPYLVKSKSEREIASFGQHGEKYSFFVYFSLTFATTWIQFAFNKDLNRYLNGDPYLCDPFEEDCSAVYQAQKAAEEAKDKEEEDGQTVDEVLDELDGSDDVNAEFSQAFTF